MKNMAITSYSLCDNIQGNNNSKGNRCGLFHQSFGPDISSKSIASKIEKKKPYSNDRVQLLSHVTQKKIIKKRIVDCMSSLPLAANIYKANSDEFKSTRRIKKKIKKSVLTLPNEPTPDAQICTVSDMNDSEYSRRDVKCKIRRKRNVINNGLKPQNKNKEYDIYDTDTPKYYNLKSSSTDLIKKYKGDSKAVSNNIGKNHFDSSYIPGKDEINNNSMKLHDVWAVLRNLNRFQFNPSPPMSDKSAITPKKKKNSNKRSNRKNTRVIETCRTKEIAYISSYKVNDSSLSLSQSSSFDRITVINKRDEASKICTELQDRSLKKGLREKYNKIEIEDKNKIHMINKGEVQTETVKTLFDSGKKEKQANFIQKYDSSDVNMTIQKNLEDSKMKCNNISSSLNSNNLKNMQCSSVVSVSNTKKSGIECNPVKHHNKFSNKRNITNKQAKEKQNKVSPNSELPQANRISLKPKVGKQSILSLIKTNQHATQKQESRLMAEKSSACVLSKLTQTESDKNGVNYLNRKSNTLFSDYNSVKSQSNKEIVKDLKCNVKQRVKNNIGIIQSKSELQSSVNSPNSVIINQKQPPKAQLKDKMLNLFSKKLSSKNFYKDYEENHKTALSRTCNSTKMKIDVYTEMEIKPTETLENLSESKRHISFNMFLNKNPHSEFKYTWAKAKWASNCIENVIKKIQNGVYCNQDQKIQICKTRLAEISIQTDQISDQESISENQYSPKMIIKEKKHINKIPGFDNSLLGLELQTLTMKQIAIKYCITNVMIHFDVTVTNEINKIVFRPNSSSLVIPIEVTENQTRIFKYKKSILNDILPAELCSIIPKMIYVIDSTIKSSLHSNCADFVDKTLSKSAINEMPRNEIIVAANDANKSYKSSVKFLSPPINKILQGLFSRNNKTSGDYVVTKVAPKVQYESTFVIDLLPRTCLIFDITQLSPILKTWQGVSLNTIDIKTNIHTQSSKSQIPHPTCSTLEVYSEKNKRLIPAFKPFDIESILRNILWNLALRFITLIQYIGKNSYLHMNINVTIQNITSDSQINKPNHDEHPIKCVEYHKRSIKNIYERKGQQSAKRIKVNNKNKRCFYKLYRKCKSSTNIPSTEKCTPLSKIKNMEDFFHILGSKQGLSIVFDGHIAKKILSSVLEMKNWMTDINPRQALLILLLTNKKDTPNLVRFRPILLQGIAVNRITRATELDMEIEVIERENLNKLPQCEGIFYLPGSTENQDHLLEELYWIAKTTASDYQRTFDESSEKLLKSLLEKRKKLNPSYLRVMARYVGLGLLKTPVKK